MSDSMVRLMVPLVMIMTIASEAGAQTPWSHRGMRAGPASVGGAQRLLARFPADAVVVGVARVGTRSTERLEALMKVWAVEEPEEWFRFKAWEKRTGVSLKDDILASLGGFGGFYCRSPGDFPLFHGEVPESEQWAVVSRLGAVVVEVQDEPRLRRALARLADEWEPCTWSAGRSEFACHAPDEPPALVVRIGDGLVVAALSREEANAVLRGRSGSPPITENERFRRATSFVRPGYTGLIWMDGARLRSAVWTLMASAEESTGVEGLLAVKALLGLADSEKEITVTMACYDVGQVEQCVLSGPQGVVSSAAAMATVLGGTWLSVIP